MQLTKNQFPASLEGSIIEIYDKDSSSFAKIYCPSAFIEVDLDKCGELSLGDKVKLSCIIQMENIEHIIEE
jgi:hypothetical protein